ncbi:MAG: bifunctional (p)ppGpp synthetase/guanosine-3',5'-bis(diphosphate) 3'-pyrophosphohydrolase [Myxococcota bacterium]|nr:bifunctional (p)ppGpp synthetase/guanosine-3',5'-bis(diphosphate) 3'-pyrophosphohydrolase [Myxococcota bacterium]
MRLDDILDTVSGYASDADLDIVIRAYFYAARAHDKQRRKSGEAYFTHPLAVAAILAELKMDVDTLATALLHDTLEDTFVTAEEIEQNFGAEVLGLVQGVTKISKLEFRSKEVAQAENFRKMLMAMSKDVRVILVKLADRLHNMRTLDHMADAKRRRIAQETLDIYAPIAGRLGLMRYRVELEDICFSYLHPEKYQELVNRMAEGEEERQAFVEEVCVELQTHLDAVDVEGLLSGRSKHLWSIYQKMVNNKLEFEQVYDLLAFRVLVEDVGQCYAVLGQIHANYRPVPQRIKDYIAMPKANGYQSLHTTVLWGDGRRLEVQIRTHAMHRVAETGIAAHWRYKAGHLDIEPEEIAKLARLRELLEVAREVEDPDEFMEVVKIDLFTEDVYVFTPAGDIKEFPNGATALDFAYAVHSEVGNHCVGAKVNGRMVPLRHQIQSGDTVEIMTSKNQHPRRDWLNMVGTGRALSRIRRYLREEEQETGQRLGREMLEAELKKRGSSTQKLVKSGVLKVWLKENNFKEANEFLVKLAQGHLSLARVVRELVPLNDEPELEELGDTALGRIIDRIRGRGSQSPVLIDGQEDVLVTFARCCSPLPKESVMGFITRGRGITVHRRDCAQLLQMDPERRVPVQWTQEAKGGTHVGNIRVICVDRPGLLANITKICTDASINISRVEARSLGDEKADCSLQVSVEDVDELGKLIRRLEKIKGVISVDRVGSPSL